MTWRPLRQGSVARVSEAIPGLYPHIAALYAGYKNSSLSIFRILSRLSKCAPKPLRASVIAARGRANSSIAAVTNGTALIQSRLIGVISSRLPA